MTDTLPPVLDRIDADLDAALGRLFELLRLPSVSTDPAHAGDVGAAAQWCAATLRDAGFSVEVVATTGHPIVLATQAGPAGAPHVLYYGHYDVQPPDPMDEWHSPPFEPTMVEGPQGPRIVARGACDDKGQLMTFVEALRAWRRVHGALPITATIMLEGEEESGSPSLPAFLASHRDRLAAADVCVVCDTGAWDAETPAITVSLRGLVYIEATISGPRRDLHSGSYGGSAINPNHVLARAIAALHDETGRVAVPGFYDGVTEPTAEHRAAQAALGFDETAYLAEVGLRVPGGERGRPALERIWDRPTCEVNGIWGGYTGAGAKTVIPARASAKISCRLVPGQDPVHVRVALETYLAAQLPEGFRISFRTFGGEPAFRMDPASPALDAARRGLARAYGREAVTIGTGGSIPVVGMLRDRIGLDCLLVGFGLDDDGVHSPNEKFDRQSFHRGIRAHAAILAELADAAPEAAGVRDSACGKGESV